MGPTSRDTLPLSVSPWSNTSGMPAGSSVSATGRTMAKGTPLARSSSSAAAGGIGWGGVGWEVGWGAEGDGHRGAEWWQREAAGQRGRPGCMGVEGGTSELLQR